MPSGTIQGPNHVQTGKKENPCPICRRELSDMTIGPLCFDCQRIICINCGQHLPAGPDGKVRK